MPERPTSWQTFVRAHWGAIAGADVFTTEVWTCLVTYDTVSVIDLASRRVQIVGSTLHMPTGGRATADRGRLAQEGHTRDEESEKR